MTAEQRQAEIAKAAEAANKAAIAGPATQGMLDQADFTIEKEFDYIPTAEGAAFMRAMGNRIGPNFVGLISPHGEGNWIAVVSFSKDGYIKDDDAKDWNADDLYDKLSKGNEAGNEERRQRGFDEIEMLGWIERPVYDATTHRLIWSVATRAKNKPGASQSAHYNTYLLGREGYFSIEFITPQSTIEARKPIARQLLADVAFKPGKRYEDFSASTDKVAAYGLAALVGGIALKKLGLLALGAAFFAKFAKLIIVGAVAAMAAFKKFFRRTPKSQPQSALPQPEKETP